MEIIIRAQIKVFDKLNRVCYTMSMKEILLTVILSALSARLASASKIEDPSVKEFAKRMAYAESNKALRVVL